MIANRTFGQALAYLEFEEKNGEPYSGSLLAEHELDCLTELKKRMQQLRQHKNNNEILGEIPDKMCQSEQTFLQDNIDFFLVLLFFQAQTKNRNDKCLKISTHLNTCYRCFEIFSQVMRNYYYKHKELFQHSNENK